MFQASILAKYKPVINATLLIPNLRQVEETTTKALEYFKSTRHIVLYYEDVVRNRTVRPLLKPRTEFPSGLPCSREPFSYKLLLWLHRY